MHLTKLLVTGQGQPLAILGLTLHKLPAILLDANAHQPAIHHRVLLRQLQGCHQAARLLVDLPVTFCATHAEGDGGGHQPHQHGDQQHFQQGKAGLAVRGERGLHAVSSQ